MKKYLEVLAVTISASRIIAYFAVIVFYVMGVVQENWTGTMAIFFVAIAAELAIRWFIKGWETSLLALVAEFFIVFGLCLEPVINGWYMCAMVMATTVLLIQLAPPETTPEEEEES